MSKLKLVPYHSQLLEISFVLYHWQVEFKYLEMAILQLIFPLALFNRGKPF